MMARITLTNVDEVINALGGVDAVAQFTKRGATAVHNWRAYRRFPASLFVKMTGRLKRRGYDAPATLWGQEGEQRIRRAA